MSRTLRTANDSPETYAELEDESDVVTCDCSSHDDPELAAAAQLRGSPKDWPTTLKWLHIAIVASMTMATPLASSIHTPALSLIASDFSISQSTASLSVPLYVLGFATGPLLFLPLSKAYGRLYIYNGANFLLLLGNLGCILSPSFAWLLAFRFAAGCGGACAITQGSGTIADIIEKENRGKAVALMAFGTVWAPILGPVVGGQVAEKFGWRGCFWVVLGVVAFNTIVTLLFMEETSTTHHFSVPHWTRILKPISTLRSSSSYAYTKLEESGQNGELQPQGFRSIAFQAVCSPFRLLLSPTICIIAALSALFYSIQIFLYTDIPATYKVEYSFTPSQTGFAFLGNGIGMTVGLLTFGLFSDRIMMYLSGDGPRVPEYRLPSMMASVLLVFCGLIGYSLTAVPDIDWIYPIITNGFIGAGLYSFSMASYTYLIDLSPETAAESATLMAIVRFPAGAAVSAISERIIGVLGRKTTKEAFALVALSALIPIFMLYRRRR